VLHKKSEGDPKIRDSHHKQITVYNYLPQNVDDDISVCSLKNTKNVSENKKIYSSLCDLMTKIEILGTGCAKCKRLLANAQQAVKDLKITADVIKVDDIDEIVNRGIMLTPALFINGKVRAEGRIPDVNEIKKMLTE
jgi:small redox-active disulfide protein 2